MSVYLMSHALKTAAVVPMDSVKHETRFNGRKNKEHLLVLKKLIKIIINKKYNSLYILYTADFNYLIRWVIITYILLDISVVNSHATSAYGCELLAVT